MKNKSAVAAMKVAQKRERNPGGTALSRLRLARVAAIVAVAVAVCGYLDHYTPTFRDLEEKTYGLRLEIADQADTRLVDQAHQQVAIVTLPDATFDPAVPGHLPGPILPRAYYAKLIHRLTRDGAKVIAFDILFDTSQPGDAAFANAMRKSGRVLLACEDMETGKPEIVPPTPLLKNTAASLGHTGVPFDAEQPAIDRIQPFLEDDGKPLPAFSVQAACMAGGAASETPTGDDRAFKIWYFGSPGKTFEQIPFQQVISQEQPAQNPFQDKVVVIGYTITTSKDRDQHWTPMGEREMWGVEIQANAIATILTKSFIRDAPPWAEVGTLIVLASAASLLAGLGGLKRTALLLVLLLPAYYYFNIWLFVAHHIDLHLIAPTAMVALTALAVLLERGMTEEQEKTRMRGLLHRYVNPQIAAYILQHPELLGRAGKRVTGTVLFSDIRGFTALSEQIPPEELVSRMNEYFQTMTEIVFRHEGTAASIVGDALLALFGVPVPSPDHAKRAVAAAIEMQGALRTLQERWRLQDRHAFDIGIGINTGEMVVGDVGGRHLMNFTVYGLQVNIASRVESLNKELGTCILITRAAYESVSEEIQARGPRRMSIKGVEEAVEVFEVIGWRNGSHPACDAPEEVNFPMTTHHIYLMAPGASIDDVRRFYGQALGLSEAAKPASLDHNPVLWFQAGSIKFHIGYPEDGIVGDGHTALSVPDLDAARERLSALGYAVDDNIIPMGYPRFYARDPWGNQFEILPEGLP